MWHSVLGSLGVGKGTHRVCAFCGVGAWERRVCEAECRWQGRGLQVLLWAVFFHSPRAGSPAAHACSEERFAAIQGPRSVFQLQPEYENPSGKRVLLVSAVQETTLQSFFP